MAIISAKEAKAIVNRSNLQKELDIIGFNIKNNAENGKTSLLIGFVSTDIINVLKELGYVLIFANVIGYTVVW